jgi:hypothetical protein
MRGFEADVSQKKKGATRYSLDDWSGQIIIPGGLYL